MIGREERSVSSLDSSSACQRDGRSRSRSRVSPASEDDLVGRGTYAQPKSGGYRVLKARPAQAEAALYARRSTISSATAFDEVSGELPPPQQQGLEVALLRREAMTPADPRTTASAL